jgi:hypothetical protein
MVFSIDATSSLFSPRHSLPLSKNRSGSPQAILTPNGAVPTAPGSFGGHTARTIRGIISRATEAKTVRKPWLRRCVVKVTWSGSRSVPEHQRPQPPSLPLSKNRSGSPQVILIPNGAVPTEHGWFTGHTARMTPSGGTSRLTTRKVVLTPWLRHCVLKVTWSGFGVGSKVSSCLSKGLAIRFPSVPQFAGGVGQRFAER